MLNRIFVVDSVTLTSTGTAVSSYTPWDQTTRKLPTQVVVKATGQGAYVRLSNDASAATNADVLVQAGDHVVLSVQGRRWVSVLSDGASSTVNVGALSTGVSGSAASLDLPFTDVSTLDSRVTFTRASSATFVGSNGLIQTTPQSKNLLLWTQEFNLSLAWYMAGSGVTSVLNNEVAPDGTNTADTLTTTVANTGVRQDVAFSNGVTYTVSVYVKSISGATGFTADLQNAQTSPTLTLSPSWQRFIWTVTASSARTWVDFQLDGIGSFAIWGAQVEVGSTATSYTRNDGGLFPPRFDYDPVTLAAKGLLIEEQRTNLLTYSESFRTQTLAVTGVSGTFVNGETVTATGGGTGTYVLAESTGSSFAIFNGSGAFTGTLTGGTSGATATISSSVTAWQRIGSTVTANATTAPDGAVNADSLTEDTSTGLHIVYRSVSITSGTVYTLSYWAKRGVGSRDLSIRLDNGTSTLRSFVNLATGAVSANALHTVTAKLFGSYWYVTCTVTATATTSVVVGAEMAAAGNVVTYTGDGTSSIDIWGAQLEAGSFATSYIPTVASQVTRSADVASVNTLSPWYNATEGTLYVEGGGLNAASSARLAGFSDGTFSNRIINYLSGSTQVAGLISTGGVAQANPTVNVTAASSANKVAIGYAANNVNVAANGTLGTLDTSASIPTVTLMRIGADEVGTGAILNGTIRRITYYHRRLSNAELQAITA